MTKTFLMATAAVAALAMADVSSVFAQSSTTYTTHSTTVETPAATRASESTMTRTVTTATAPAAVTTVNTSTVRAAETRWTVEEKARIVSGAQTFDVTAFDLNGDGMLTRAEVGEGIFLLYDTDGNMVLDNLEFKRPAILTVVPVDKTMVIQYDFNGDGIVDQQETTHETFIRDSMLARFDGDNDGLTPEEFTQRSFLQADRNNDKVVDIQEWKASYDELTNIKVENKARVNN